MLKYLVKDRLFISLIAVSIFIRLFSLNEAWVEQYYTYGFYPVISKILRAFFGWIPFSVGDLLYVIAVLFVLSKVWKALQVSIKRRWKEQQFVRILVKYAKVVLWVYIIFNLFWGLNYNRQGVAKQLELDVTTYSVNDLYVLTGILHQKLNFYAAQVDSLKREGMNNNQTLFKQAVKDYKNVRDRYPFLSYNFSSIKPSLYGASGKYFGYTGYYNPFSAEAQLKTSIPVFWKPFVTNHEIAHQLGYAKENEASFVSFLVSKESGSVDSRYSIYYHLFFSASGQLISSIVRNEPGLKETMTYINLLRKSLHSRVKNDLREERNYYRKNNNKISPYVSDAYDKYLKLNNQPKGMATYNEVIALLVAYMKKFGKNAI